MTNDEYILEVAQKIYLARKNQKNDVTGADLESFIDDTIDWINQFLPELELEADWNFSRVNDNNIGTITSANTISYELPDDIRTLVYNYDRDLTIRQDGTIISTFKLVNPNQISNPNDYEVKDRATVIGNKLIFSRPLRDTEVGGSIVADSILKLPPLSRDDTSVLDIVQPQQLLILGVLKNQVLPDIVQGGLTPSFTQKYADLLEKCVKDNNMSSDASDFERENLAFVGGIW